jgi:hypothetical protein
MKQVHADPAGERLNLSDDAWIRSHEARLGLALESRLASWESLKKWSWTCANDRQGELHMNKNSCTLLACMLMLAGCATHSGRPPLTPLESAQLAVARADEARVGDFAYDDMSNARQRLVEARAASSKAQASNDAAAARNARQFAEEATADAELATAKAQYARIQAATFALKQQLGLIAAPPPETMQPEPDTIPDPPMSPDAPTIDVPVQTQPGAPA